MFVRKGTFHINGELEDIFPLLRPKREEDRIPRWRCETIYPKSGYNEEGAIFTTTEAYGTELYWTTLQHDIERKYLDFLMNAPRLFNFRLTIGRIGDGDGLTASMSQTFTSLCEEGSLDVERISRQDFQELLHSLEGCINLYLKIGTRIQT